MKRSLFGVVALAVAAVSIVLIGAASAKPPAPTNPSCPGSTKNLLAADNVGASAIISGQTATYTFDSFVDQSPVNGVPGLVKYCVYDTPVPASVDTDAEGADGSDWTAAKGAKSFSFSRPGGEKTNIPLDGTSTEVGTATWGPSVTVPPAANHTLVLHISDQAECLDVYGVVTPTCFVLPGEEPGLVCDAAAADGDAADAAYNNIPKDAINCGPPSHAFEATETKEFGDEVTLDGIGKLVSLSVLFNSYGCADAPLWNNGQCATLDENAEFQHEITANIYAASELALDGTVVPGDLIATATETKTFPFRPSADLALCKDVNDVPTGQYFNTVSQTCTFSEKVIHTFTQWEDANGVPFDPNTMPNISGNVVWTVAYNTTHHGYNPMGEDEACFGVDGGCGYDSLNVGTKTFANSAYAGEYVDDHGAFINSTWSGIYCDDGPITGTLRASTNPPTPCDNFGALPATPDTPSNPNYAKEAWLGYQPLGMIVLNQT